MYYYDYKLLCYVRLIMIRENVSLISQKKINRTTSTNIYIVLLLVLSVGVRHEIIVENTLRRIQMLGFCVFHRRTF